jgi:hypothetical protein
MDDQAADTAWWETMPAEVWEAYAPGQHWTPFGKGAAEAVMRTLPAALATCSVATTALVNRRHQAMNRAMPPSEPRAGLLACSPGPVSTMVTLEIRTDGNHVSHVFPFIDPGPNVAITLSRVLLMPDRCAAVLEGIFPDGTEVAFFDAHWPATRGLYARGAAPEFCLGVLAYRFRVMDETDRIPLPAWVEEVRARHPDALPEDWTVEAGMDLSRLDAWIMRTDIAPDEVEMQGEVLEVRRLHEALLGCGIWRVDVQIGGRRIAVMLADPVAGGVVPARGDRVAVYGWVHGRLWWVP